MIAGWKLRQFRESRKVRAVDVANALGEARQRITQIEQTDEVGQAVAERYLTGVLSVALDAEPDVQLFPVLVVNGRVEPWPWESA